MRQLSQQNPPNNKHLNPSPLWEVGTIQPIQWFLGGKGLGIQQGMSVWVRSPKSPLGQCRVHYMGSLIVRNN
jgi:hypothetical protein